MTEHEWQAGADPELMLEFLGNSASERKIRLFVCACCRRFDLGHASKNAINAAEEHADGLISREKLREILAGGSRWAHRTLERAQSVRERTLQMTAWEALNVGALDDAVMLKAAMELVDAHDVIDQITATSEPFPFSRLLRCIFGNPFRPIALDSRWRTSTVVELATAIYKERSEQNMPILADALMDAGCDSEEIISHCQSDGPHVRGCWVVDLILGY